MFQSTHPHGVRLKSCRKWIMSVYGFNPRTRTGCDGYNQMSDAFYRSFNPRTRTGCDTYSWQVLAIVYSFNPDPHGVRIAFPNIPGIESLFHHAPHGCTFKSIYEYMFLSIRHRRVDEDIARSFDNGRNPRRTVRSRKSDRFFNIFFNSHPHGATLSVAANPSLIIRFQFTTPARVRTGSR